MSDDHAEWTEGVCGDGAAILRDGQMVSISEILAILNKCESARASAFEEAAKIAEDMTVARRAYSPRALGKLTPECEIAAAIREHAKK